MSATLFNEYINKMYIEKEKLDAFWNEYKLQKKNCGNESLISPENRTVFASILRLHGNYFGELNEIRGIDFSFMNLSYVDLSNLIFVDCNFEYASFYGSNLDAAIFEKCQLNHVNFKEARLEIAEFYGSNLSHSKLDGAHLLSAYFKKCNLNGASLKGTNLLEIEAVDTMVDGIIIDNNTSINSGTFENVDWSKVDVSNLNMSIDQIKHFVDCSKGLSKTQVYNETLTVSKVQEIQDSIFNALYEGELINPSLYSNSAPDIFISYAREKETYAKALVNTLKDKYDLWWDDLLKDGDKLSEVVKQTICHCKVAIVVFSKEYLIKGWPRYEFYELYRKAKSSNFKLIIVIDNYEINADSGEKTIVKNPIDIETVKTLLEVEHSENIIFALDTDSVYDIIKQII